MTQNVESLLVSIVISAYNEEKYLPGLIEDLKNQTYPKENIEILFINAMSADGTTAIIQQFIKKTQSLTQSDCITILRKIKLVVLTWELNIL